MKLPGSTLIPCRNQMAPNETKRPAKISKAILIVPPCALICNKGTAAEAASYLTRHSAAIGVLGIQHNDVIERVRLSNRHSIISGYADRRQEQLFALDPGPLEAFLRRSCQQSGDAASRPSYRRNTSGLRR